MPARRFRRSVTSVDAILTSACNLRCAYCYQNAKRHTRMEWATLRACIDLLLASDREDLSLTFYGGEPLIEFRSIRRAVAYADAARPPGKRLRYSIITNGTMLGEECTEFLAARPIETRLSFDGIAPSQRLRAKGTFRLLDRLLDRLRSDHPSFFHDHFAVNVVLHSGNLRYFADSIDYLLGKGIHSIIVSPSVTHDPGWHRDSIEELDAQFARVFRSSLRHYRRTGRVPLAAFRKVATESYHDPTGLSLCGIARGEALAVGPDGATYGCVMLADEYQVFPSDSLLTRLRPMRMGDLRDPRFPERFAGFPAAVNAAEIFDDRHLKHSVYGRCRRCRFVLRCSVCPVSIGRIPGNVDPHRVPDSVCAFNLVSLKFRERFPMLPDAEAILTGTARVPLEMREIRSFVRVRENTGRR